MSIPVTNAKAGWKTVGGQSIYFRSRWEANYARFLQFQKEIGVIKEWEHEPHTFWFENIKRGCRSYLPDFRVSKGQGAHYWVEVKGYMDAKSKTKIARFKRYFPNEELVVINRDWFERNPGFKNIIGGWE